MRGFGWVGCSLVVVLALAGWAQGQSPSFNPGPFSHHWNFEAPPLKGEINKIEILREIEREGQPPKQQRTSTLVFKALPDGGYTVGHGPEQKPHEVVTYDASGRPVSVVSHAVVGVARNNPGTPVTTTERATYDEAGRLLAIEIQKSNDPAQQRIEFTHAEAADGGRTMSWSHGEFTYTVTYDAQGRMVGYSTKYVRSRSMDTKLTYNEHGDIVTVTHAQPIQEHEYQYDDRGNWIRQTRYSVSDGKRGPGEVWLRKIHYGKPPAGEVAKASKTDPKPPAGGPTPPPESEAVAIDPAKLPGEYHSSRGEVGSGLYAGMTVTLKPDRSATFLSVREFRKDRFEDKLTGKWSVEDKVLTVHLEKHEGGKPLPEEMRTLRFQMNAAGDLVPRHDGKTAFKRVADKP